MLNLQCSWTEKKLDSAIDILKKRLAIFLYESRLEMGLQLSWKTESKTDVHLFDFQVNVPDTPIPEGESYETPKLQLISRHLLTSDNSFLFFVVNLITKR